VNLTIAGTHNGIQTSGPEARAPYWVFGIDKQQNVAGPYPTKWQAKFKLLRLQVQVEGKPT
jgi:hypothetical protein